MAGSISSELLSIDGKVWIKRDRGPVPSVGGDSRPRECLRRFVDTCWAGAARTANSASSTVRECVARCLALPTTARRSRIGTPSARSFGISVESAVGSDAAVIRSQSSRHKQAAHMIGCQRQADCRCPWEPWRASVRTIADLFATRHRGGQMAENTLRRDGARTR